jgi:hypothetical protein
MKYEVGDVVMDSWGVGAPEEATVTEVKKTMFGRNYYVSKGSYHSPYPRSSRDLKLVETKDDETRKLKGYSILVTPKPAIIRTDSVSLILGKGAKGNIIAVRPPRTRFGNASYIFECNGGRFRVGTKDFEYIAEEKKPPRYVSSDGWEAWDVGEIQRRQIARQRAIREAMEMKKPRSEVMRNTPQEPQRSDWFDVIAKKDLLYMSGRRNGAILEVKHGSMLRMRALSDGTYEVETAGEHVRIKEDAAVQCYEKYDINDYATEYPRRKTKEDEDMGGELFGYPPEDDVMVPGTSLAKLEMQRTEEKRKAEEEIAELKRQLEEQTRKNEVARREQVAEEYGIVAERHLWSVTVDVPMQWSGPIPKRGCEETTEVLTEGRNMVEAAMAAEAMAKGISEKAHVLSIDYVRVIGAIKN